MPQVPSTPKLLVVAEQISDSFMRDDLRIIHQFTDASILELATSRFQGAGRLGRVLRAAVKVTRFVSRLLRYNMRVVIFWFASKNYAPVLATIARLLGRRVIVVTGGKDAVYGPDLDWGDLKTRWDQFRFRWLMRRSDAVLPFSDSARRLIMRDYAPRYIRTAYPAIDTRFFAPTTGRRVPRVVTCCYQYSQHNIIQKGLDHFVAAARRLPELQFVLVGNAVDETARTFAAGVPANVSVIPRLIGRTAYRDFLAASEVATLRP